ncbi:MAG: DUF1887 family protein [Oscillospiraceae bacterium]|nr:DUF1887 family protein [Oscillospiraceae bacterium]
METLIELYDERPLENVLGVEVFRPERVVYVCPARIASDRALHRRLRSYFAHRGQEISLEFVKADMYRSDAILKTLRKIVARYPDCAMDITGGTDAVLYAAGMLGAETPIPAFTYSRKKNRFYEIQNADFAAGLPCEVVYSVEDCIRMAGGELRPGRVNNQLLADYVEDIQPFYRLYLKHRREWVRLVGYIQRLSAWTGEGPAPLSVRGDYNVKGERGSRIDAPEDALRALRNIGFLRELSIDRENGVSFCFRDLQIRSWLRDVGVVLELFVYQCCVELGIFDDVRLSAVVDWEESAGRNAVSNELDVMCTRGVTPVFISCKTGEAKSEALNELAILRDRFGGGIARAAIVTAEQVGELTRSRAAELNIQVIDLNDLDGNRLSKRIKKLMQS